MGKEWKTPIKAAAAQKRGQIFTKVAREVQVAAKIGGPDPEGNSRLKLAIAAARAVSCPKETIERAIKKGAGLLDDGTQIEEVTYEGTAPYGVGVIIECQTDNKNRTVGELRNIFKRHNGSLGESGSSSWMFERVAVVTGNKNDIRDAEEEAIEVNANSVEKNENGSYSFYGAPTDLDSIRTGLMSRGWSVEAAERSYLPKNVSDLNETQIQEIHELLQEIEEFDDSHRIFATVKN